MYRFAALGTLCLLLGGCYYPYGYGYGYPYGYGYYGSGDRGGAPTANGSGDGGAQAAVFGSGRETP